MQNTTANTPVAPVVGVQGKATPGGHVLAYKAQPAFGATATLQLVAGTNNPWRPGTPGHAFYVQVLAGLAPGATVAQCIAAAATAKVPGATKAGQVQGHLRWLYTWGGAYLAIDGKLYGGAAYNLPVLSPQPAQGVPGATKAGKPGKVAKVA